jgi:hypothetical protein
MKNIKLKLTKEEIELIIDRLNNEFIFPSSAEWDNNFVLEVIKKIKTQLNEKQIILNKE